jgi:hypothetical protein
VGGNRKENLNSIAGSNTLPDPSAYEYYFLPITVKVGFHVPFNNNCN